MKHLDGAGRGMILLGVVGLLGVGAWGVGNRLSSDAIGLALGVIFGILATLPGALLALAANLRAARRTQPPTYYAPPPARQLPPPTVMIVQLPDGRHRRVALLDDPDNRAGY